jgi:hypothetical protein
MVLVTQADSGVPLSDTSDYEVVAAHGRALLQSLHLWWLKSRCQHEKETPSPDPQVALATIYYHATSIYLSGIFDYRHYLHDYAGPHLPQHVIDSHVNSIVAETQHALGSTKLAGILFFYSLRVAGSRATTLQQRSSIMEMLQVIKDRNFMVAEAFTVDLHKLWEQQSAVGIPQTTLD